MKSRTIPHSRVSTLSPGRIALGYAVIAILWIAFSDAIVTNLKLNPFVMTIKGGVFVFVTAWLLYFTTRRLVHALSRLNRELRAISDCNQVLLRCTDEQSLLEKICRLCEEAGYGMAWVAYAEHDEARSVRPVAWAGTDEAYLTAAGISWSEDTERGRGPTGTAIRSGKTCCNQDFATDARVAPWRDLLLQRGLRSALALPLKDEHGGVFGTLTIHSERRNAFTPEEIHMLEELAGDLAFGIVTLRSRAARQRAEQELALLGFALDNVREAALLSDEQGLLRYVNEHACRVLGYPRAELLRMGIPDIDPEFPAERWHDHWRELQAKKSLSFESRHRTRDGRLFPAEISANYFEYGGLAYNLALVRDITERKRAEEALRESETNLNRAQEIAHIGSWHLDVVRNRLTWSDEVFRIFGVPLGTALTYDAFLDMVHPEDRESVHKAWSAALQGAPYDIEHRIVVGLDLKWVREQAEVEFDREGHATSGIGTVQDITERKRAEEAVLEERIRERTRIARELHDTLLQTFQATLIHVGVAFKRLEPGETKQKLGRALGLAEQALTEARESIHALRSSRAEDDIVAALRDVAEGFAAEHPSSTVFQVKVRGTPLGLSRGVRDEAFKIGREALRNAFRHASADRIQLEISFDIDTFRLVVADDGKGIDSKILAQGGREGHYGLFGIRERAKLIGGELGLRSELGVGTELELNVPGPLAYATPDAGRASALERGTAPPGG